MPLWVIMSVVSMLLFGWGDYLYKRAALAGAEPMAVLANVIWFVAPLYLINALVVRETPFTMEAWWYGLLGAAITSFGYIFFLKSLARGESSISTLLFRLNFLVTAVFSITLLAEPLTGAKTAGLALAVGALAIVAMGRGKARGSGPIPAYSVAYGVASMGVMGVAYVIFKIGMLRGADPNAIAVVQAVPSYAITALVAHVQGQYKVTRTSIGYSAYLGAVTGAGLLLMFNALALGEASAVSPITQLSFVVTFVMAVFLLREKMTLPKVAALACSVLAIFALSR